MDKNELKKFIEKVADIEDLKPKKDPAIRLDNDAQDVVKYEGEWVEVTAKENPTLGFKFIKLKDRHALCELGCGDIVTNQVIERRLAITPVKHWRTQCKACKCYVSPDGLGFIEGGHEIAAAYMKHFNCLKATETRVNTLDPNSQIKEYIRDKPSKWVTDKNGNISLRGD